LASQAVRRYHQGFAFYVAFPQSSIRPLGLPIYIARASRVDKHAQLALISMRPLLLEQPQNETQILSNVTGL
jgi:hypothetical protein